VRHYPARPRRATTKPSWSPQLLIPGHNGLVPNTSAGEDFWTSSGLDFLIAVDRRGRGVGAALQQAVRDAVRSGRLRSGDPLPSSRALARDLGVARGTVVEVYEQLVAEGWLLAQRGQGTRVADLPIPPPAPAEPPTPPPPRHDLRPGHHDPSSFPRQSWAAVIRRVLAEAPDEAFGYPDPHGRAELREALAGYLGRARGVRATAGSLQVCTGAGHGLGIVFRVLSPGHRENTTQPTHSNSTSAATTTALLSGKVAIPTAIRA